MYIIIMVASILVSWAGGLAVNHYMINGRCGVSRVFLILSVLFGLGLLGFFKYSDFVINIVNDLTNSGIPLTNLVLPIGISFYTFQTLSYVIDVYRGNAPVQRNLISYGAYVAMFPQLIAGPIVQYRTISAQLNRREESSEEFAQGVIRFTVGLGKKVLLANNAGVLWDTIRLMDVGNMPVITAWTGIAAYTFQIYFDFSGYSDMAIGLGHMFGFRFLENFDHPYLSESVTEFWRRWHISLGTWFREYVYIPLGGNRVGEAKFIRNVMIVWMLTGIWHGADWNFIIWGLYYGVILLIEKMVLRKAILKLPSWLRHVYTMLIVMIGWFIFSYNEIPGGMGYLLAMFGCGRRFIARGTVYILYSNLVLLVCLILGSTDIPRGLSSKLLSKVDFSEVPSIVLRSLFILGVFILSIAYLVGESYNPFLYFRF